MTTVVYCFDSENVIGGSVAFRRAVTTDQAQLVALEAGNIEVATDIFGVKEDDPAVQEIGRVSVEENRLISFPNVIGPFCSGSENRLLTIADLPDKTARLSLVR